MGPHDSEGQRYYETFLRTLANRSLLRAPLSGVELQPSITEDLALQQADSPAARLSLLTSVLQAVQAAQARQGRQAWKTQQGALQDFLALVEQTPKSFLEVPSFDNTLGLVSSEPSLQQNPLAAYLFDPQAFNRLLTFMGFAHLTTFERDQIESFHTRIPQEVADFAKRMENAKPEPGLPGIKRAGVPDVNRGLAMCSSPDGPCNW